MEAEHLAKLELGLTEGYDVTEDDRGEIGAHSDSRVKL